LGSLNLQQGRFFSCKNLPLQKDTAAIGKLAKIWKTFGIVWAICFVFGRNEHHNCYIQVINAYHS